MHTTDYIPRPQAVFNNWQETLVAYLLANLGRFGLTTDMLDALMALQAAWRDAWAAASNPDTRTKATVQAKNEALAAYKAGIRQFVNEHLAYKMRWVISLTQPTSLDQITHSEFSTRSAIVLDFDENQRGQRIWLIARWENTRGQKGPWTDILSAIIP
ncbi:MAG: hypothetical protein LBK99_02600 [Opitutaceae bacterium]|jgi:hypothetical protein|nr:hypothetical protein [Opitutaceae bacterium]